MDAELTRIYNSIATGLYIYNLGASTNDFLNNEYTRITGWNLEEVNAMGEKFLELFHPDDLDAVLAHMKEVATSTTDDTISIEYRFKTKDDRWIWCLSYDTPLDRDESGKLVRFIGSFINITARKEQEMRIERHAKELEELNSAMTNRELKMVELKKEIKQLREQLESQGA